MPGLDPRDVPLPARSRRFPPGLFHHLTQTHDPATCRQQAHRARAAASSDHPQRLRYLATAAWWDAVADRCHERTAVRQ
jgi:hypothetical protein